LPLRGETMSYPMTFSRAAAVTFAVLSGITENKGETRW
jgi:hypothetical protein